MHIYTHIFTQGHRVTQTHRLSYMVAVTHKTTYAHSFMLRYLYFHTLKPRSLRHTFTHLHSHTPTHTLKYLHSHTVLLNTHINTHIHARTVAHPSDVTHTRTHICALIGTLHKRPALLPLTPALALARPHLHPRVWVAWGVESEPGRPRAMALPVTFHFPTNKTWAVGRCQGATEQHGQAHSEPCRDPGASPYQCVASTSHHSLCASVFPSAKPGW